MMTSACQSYWWWCPDSICVVTETVWDSNMCWLHGICWTWQSIMSATLSLGFFFKSRLISRCRIAGADENYNVWMRISDSETSGAWLWNITITSSFHLQTSNNIINGTQHTLFYLKVNYKYCFKPLQIRCYIWWTEALVYDISQTDPPTLTLYPLLVWRWPCEPIGAEW